MRVHNIYADEQGESHFRDIEVEWAEEGPDGTTSKRFPATFRWISDTHTEDNGMLRRSIGAITIAALVGLAAPLQAQTAQSPEIAAVRAANNAYLAAFSARDITAMEAVWAKSTSVAAIHPFSRAPLSGWDAVRSSYVETFTRFKDVVVSANEAHAAVNGNTAWVVATETLRGQRPNGEAFTATAMSTNIFQKLGDRWLMVLHHAAGVPQ